MFLGARHTQRNARHSRPLTFNYPAHNRTEGPSSSNVLMCLMLTITLLSVVSLVTVHLLAEEDPNGPKASKIKVKKGAWWKNPNLGDWKGCVPKPPRSSLAVQAPRGYLKMTLVPSSPLLSLGALASPAQPNIHLYRTQVCDAVALARYLGARLVVPDFIPSLYAPHWFKIPPKEPKPRNVTFNKLFDLEYFEKALKKDVVVMKEKHLDSKIRKSVIQVSPPTHPMSAVAQQQQQQQQQDPVASSASSSSSLGVSGSGSGSAGTGGSWGGLEWYDQNVRPLLQDDFFVHLPFTDPADFLPFDPVPNRLQRLRCRACFHALQWGEQLVRVGSALLDRLHDEADMHTNSAHYLSLHLPPKSTLPPHTPHPLRKACVQQAAAEAQSGGGPGGVKYSFPFEACFLTVDELALFLRTLGFPKTTPLFLSGWSNMTHSPELAPLRAMFPHLHCKESLLTVEELHKFDSLAQLAVLDYIVSLHASVHVVPRRQDLQDLLIGERTYFGRGPTLAAPTAALVEALLDFNATSNKGNFAKQYRKYNPDVDSLPVRRPSGTALFTGDASVYKRPVPDCMCSKDNSVILDS